MQINLLILSNVNMNSNKAFGKGGHVYTEDASFTSSNTNFRMGSSDAGGGAIALIRCTANITASFASNNTCNKCCGGAIYVDNVVSSIVASIATESFPRDI